MKKVLLGWELGAGQGHIQPLAALAQALKAEEIEPVFALKSYKIKGINLPWQTVIAPRLPFSGRNDSFTYGDILVHEGRSTEAEGRRRKSFESKLFVCY